MKAKILAGVMGAVLYGGIAVADDTTGQGPQRLDPSTPPYSTTPLPDSQSPSMGGGGYDTYGTIPPESTYTTTTTTKTETKTHKRDGRGLSVMAGGGIDTYTGSYAPEINT